MNFIKLILGGKLAITKYFAYSLIVAFIDTSIVWALVRYTEIHLVAANTTGVIIGFLLHYILASKSVFRTEYGIAGFIIYFATFLFGLTFANWLIVTSYEYVFAVYGENLRILLSKGISVAIPFFVMYLMRKYLFLMLNQASGKGR